MATQNVRRAYLLAGLPGAGKSAARDIGATLTGGGVLKAGDMIREMARADGIDNPTSDELGEYAKEQREIAGPGFFAEKANGMMLRDEIEVKYPLWIDSVRHVNGVREFREYFDTTLLLYIDASFLTRLGRVQERGREGEDEWDAADLLARDSRELEHLGTQTILDSDEIDHVVPNEGTLEQLEEAIRRIANV